MGYTPHNAIKLFCKLEKSSNLWSLYIFLSVLCFRMYFSSGYLWVSIGINTVIDNDGLLGSSSITLFSLSIPLYNLQSL